MEKQNWVRQWPWQTGGCGVRVRGGGSLEVFHGKVGGCGGVGGVSQVG